MSERRPNPRTAQFSAGAGLRWFLGALGLVRTQPMRLMALGLMLQLLAGLTQAGLFGLLVLLAMPVFAAGMLDAMDRVRNGHRPSLGSLFAGFGRPDALLALILLGGLVLAALLLTAGWAIAGLLPELDPDLIRRLEAGDTQAMLDLDPALIERVLYGVLIGLFLGAGLSFFSVPLVWFLRNGLGQAIFDGIVAMLRQWKALLVLGLLLGVLSIPPSILTVLSITYVAMGEAPPFLLSLSTLLVVVSFQVLAFAAQYVCFAEIFEWRAPRAEAREEDQLVA